MAKRTLLESIATDDPTLFIKLDGSEDNLPAHRGVLEVASTCVKHLPPSDTWDLSLLKINGAPVHRSVVIAWLEVVRTWEGPQANSLAYQAFLCGLHLACSAAVEPGLA